MVYLSTRTVNLLLVLRNARSSLLVPRSPKPASFRKCPCAHDRRTVLSVQVPNTSKHRKHALIMGSRVFALSFVCLLLYAPSATPLRAVGVTTPLTIDETRTPAWLPLAVPPFENGRNLLLLDWDRKCEPATPFQTGGSICTTGCKCVLTTRDCGFKATCNKDCGSCNCDRPTHPCECVCTTCGKVGDCSPVPKPVPVPAPAAAVDSKAEQQAYQQAYKVLCQVLPVWCRCPKLPTRS